MEISDALMKNLLHMSRLELSAQGCEKMRKKVKMMVSWLEKLRDVDTKKVDPLVTMSAEENRFREDVPEVPLDVEQALVNAPGRSSHYFQTPTVQVFSDEGVKSLESLSEENN